ncbi:accessory gene regulator B family protein [uncultured Vagococcus sp.]|uniref:accessory gene regulator B family protein n=1 Tax=uncultured Vagococcus sp. TaxID=189676 RepID=UPI0028D75B4D|nr:accessory gene regulator B family protein [uncultured Vagococcus sp.]
MSEQLINITVNKLISYKIVSEGQRLIYFYGFQILILKIVHLLSIMSIGILFSNGYLQLLFLLSYTTLRKYTGGFHFKNQNVCWISSMVISILVSVINIPLISNSFLIGYFTGCLFIIWLLCPISNEFIFLSSCKKQCYKRKAILFYIVCVVLFFSAKSLGLDELPNVLLLSISVNTILIIIGWLSSEYLSKRNDLENR